MHQPAVLRIASTWDGRSIPEADIATVTVRPQGEALRVEVDALYHADPPPPAAPGPTDRLWEYEVVELFLAAQVGGAWHYTEIELSPHGHHLVIRFEGRRNPIERALALEYAARIDALTGRWHGNAAIPSAYLPAETSALRANAYALHGPPGARAHLAATPLPGPTPDFHQPERFHRLAAFT